MVSVGEPRRHNFNFQEDFQIVVACTNDIVLWKELAFALGEVAYLKAFKSFYVWVDFLASRPFGMLTFCRLTIS